MKPSQRTRIAGSALCLFILGSALRTASAEAPPLQPGGIVESKAVAESAGHVLEPYTVTVHVLLQTHLTPILARRASQDAAALAACQDSLLSTALMLAGNGVRAVVIEGFYASGTLKNPLPLTGATARVEEKGAKWDMLGRKELEVYGFAIQFLNDYSNAVVNELGTSAVRAQALAKSGAKATAIEKAAIDRLIQEEVTRVNVFRAGIIPATSFVGLQTALAVALARNTRQVQLVIGKEHWPDLVYGANRQKDIRLRLIPYACAD